MFENIFKLSMCMHAIVFVQSQLQAVDDSSRAASGSASATVTTTSSYDDGVAALVLDNGGYMFKAGFAGDDAPRAVFSSVVTGSPITNTAFTRSARNGFVGENALSYQKFFHLEYPIQRGLITDWDQMEKVFYYNNSYGTQLLYTFLDLASYFLQ